ncbi:alginate lyase family protein [Flexithrix dorotheae]|uniref:alginate lyase family protein n=1 Tax=Flexithrix dorotheae TaxID=70993 RepID=UPI00036728B2|nr:alginate lyase family protein [Flexithrix dorotheae]
MSSREILFRINQKIQSSGEKIFKMGWKCDKKLISLPPSILPKINFEAIPMPPNYIQIFDCQLNYYENIDWSLDLSSNKRFPKTFSKNIDIRTDQFGSAKHVWEVNRLQFLTYIAIHYRKTNNESYLEKFVEILESWIDNNGYLEGVNWYSNIEVNIRLINWFLCWELLDVNQLLKGNQKLSEFVQNKWIPSIYQHCVYSFNNPSKFSSANNHLISEYAGLFIAASFWEFKESALWKKHSKKGLEYEIINQHTADGINKEQAAEYIQFITDFFLLCYIVGENTKDQFSSEYKETLHKIISFIFNLMDNYGNIPFYGDEDDGKVFILHTSAPFDNFKSLLISGSVLYNKSEYKKKGGGFDSKNLILFGQDGLEKFNKLEGSEKTDKSKYYKESGHFLFKNKFYDQDVYIYFDAAPLGYLSIAAHGHADALSFVLYYKGQPLFIDSGTFTYHTQKEWREYFMGTSSHNTIRIDGQNQAEIAGPTMWLNHFSTRVLSHGKNENFEWIEASHSGYHHLGVEHQRKLLIDINHSTVFLEDKIVNLDNKAHKIEVFFHFHPNVELGQENSHAFSLSLGQKEKALLSLDDRLEVGYAKGGTDPILGWYSEGFQKKEPCGVLICNYSSEKTITLKSHIKFIP